jgi:hypothetical protein
MHDIVTFELSFNLWELNDAEAMRAIRCASRGTHVLAATWFWERTDVMRNPSRIPAFHEARPHTTAHDLYTASLPPSFRTCSKPQIHFIQTSRKHISPPRKSTTYTFSHNLPHHASLRLLPPRTLATTRHYRPGAQTLALPPLSSRNYRYHYNDVVAPCEHVALLRHLRQ